MLIFVVTLRTDIKIKIKIWFIIIVIEWFSIKGDLSSPRNTKLWIQETIIFRYIALLAFLLIPILNFSLKVNILNWFDSGRPDAWIVNICFVKGHFLLQNVLDWTWSSLVEGDKGSDQLNCQTNLIIVLCEVNDSRLYCYGNS